MTDKHQPIKLGFYSLSMYSWRAATAAFQSNKGHKLEVELLPEEIEVLKGVVAKAEERALREIPEALAEVIAERRVQEILQKREAAALIADGTAPDSLGDEEIPF